MENDGGAIAPKKRFGARGFANPLAFGWIFRLPGGEINGEINATGSRPVPDDVVGSGNPTGRGVGSGLGHRNVGCWLLVVGWVGILWLGRDSLVG